MQDQNDNFKKNNRNISLSRLSNVINDMILHEERVFMMITNFLEKLNDVFIRLKKINMKINFIKITRFQICESFTRIYFFDDYLFVLATFELKKIIEKFEAKLKKNSFTSVDIQEFLLTRKTDFMKALKKMKI